MSRPRSSGLGVAFDPMAALALAERRRNTPERFWARFDRTVDGCWEWAGRRAPEGYGFVSWCGVDVGAHRLAFALTHGPIASGQVVRHTCDNPPCCNPAHLIIGSVADNNADMFERGRGRTDQLVRLGTTNHNAKLDDDMVRELRSAWARGESIKSISARTGLAMGTVHPMLHGKTWRHVAPAERVSSVALRLSALQEAR